MTTAGSAHTPSSLWIGVDVGGTKLAAGLADPPRGRTDSVRVVPTRPARGGDTVLEEAAALVDSIEACAQSQGTRVAGLGIAICELVSPAGEILSAATIPWTREAVLKRFSRFPAVSIEADVRAAALAEARFGAARDCRSALYITIGTGISCCLLLDGIPYTGATGATGTFASQPITRTCSQCGAQRTTSLEEFASGAGIVARYAARTGHACHRAEDVLTAATQGDTIAAAIVRSADDALGESIGQLVNVLDPERVVLGGGLGLAQGTFARRLDSAIRRNIWAPSRRDLPVARARSGPDAGILGAAVAAWLAASRSGT